jgi:hypothetical protein
MDLERLFALLLFWLAALNFVLDAIAWAAGLAPYVDALL